MKITSIAIGNFVKLWATDLALIYIIFMILAFPKNVPVVQSVKIIVVSFPQVAYTTSWESKCLNWHYFLRLLKWRPLRSIVKRDHSPITYWYYVKYLTTRWGLFSCCSCWSSVFHFSIFMPRNWWRAPTQRPVRFLDVSQLICLHFWKVQSLNCSLQMTYDRLFEMNSSK